MTIFQKSGESLWLMMLSVVLLFLLLCFSPDLEGQPREDPVLSRSTSSLKITSRSQRNVCVQVFVCPVRVGSSPKPESKVTKVPIPHLLYMAFRGRGQYLGGGCSSHSRPHLNP